MGVGGVPARKLLRTHPEPAQLRLLRRRYCSDLLQDQQKAAKCAPSRSNRDGYVAATAPTCSKLTRTDPT